MGIEVTWHDDANNIIRYRLRDPWTLDDLIAAIRAGYEMSADRPALIILYDFQGSRRLPPAFFSALGTMRKMMQDNVQVRLVIAAPAYIHTIYGMFTRLAPDLTNAFVFVEDEAAALELLASLQTG